MAKKQIQQNMLDYINIFINSFLLDINTKKPKMSSQLQSSTKAQLSLNSMSDNPYELLKKMNKVISDQKQQIEQFQIAFDSLQRQKQILAQQKRKLQAITIELLNRIEQLKKQKNNQNVTSFSTNKISKVNLFNFNPAKNNFILSPKHDQSSSRPFQKVDQAKSGVFQIRDNYHNISKRIEDTLSTPQEYIPQPVRLSAKNKTQRNSLSFINNMTVESFYKKQYIYGENMLQTFTIIGPDITEFKKKRSSQKGKDQITVKPTFLNCSSKYYKQNKAQFLAEIAKRAFPGGCKLKKKLIDHNEQLLDIIEYKSNHNLSQDYFVFSLKGDQSLFKNTAQNPFLKKTLLYISNSNYFLFIVCLKLPDFIYIRDEKNYHRKQNQVWVGQKIYAIATYYPFFQIYTQILCRIHQTMSKTIMKKILIDNENVLTWNIAKSVYDVDKNEEINQFLKYFANKRPDYNQVCYHSLYYFGTLPQFGYKSMYAMSLFCCPVYFSNFSYEEMLLMLTAIFCQKTLIFMSSVQTKATLSALFLINLISPFQYSDPLLLNCDSEKVQSMIFEFPFALICSIKKTEQNLQQILQLFAQSNVTRSKEDDAQYILIDVDSNSILYHHVLDRSLFNQCIVQPDKQIRQAYLNVNSCDSKSFSLPKLLPRQNFKPNTKPKSELQKRNQQIKKSAKQYLNKISTNQTKNPQYRRNQKHEQLLKLLTQYIQQFTLNSENDYEILNKLQTVNKNVRKDIVKGHLLAKYRNREKIIQKFLESQMYANYLDSILKNS